MERKSRWWGFDFDAIAGHAKGVGLDDDQLEEVKRAATTLPYTETRRSTGGNGIHIYVRMAGAGFESNNHTEHAALGRCVLAKMSSDCGFDFAQQIDTCGGNMWIWHRKMTTENRGLELLQAAETPLTSSDMPDNWRDHIPVISRRQNRVSVSGVADQEHFGRLTASQRVSQLDDSHKQVMQALEDSEYSSTWIHDHSLFNTHTKAIKNLMDDAECRKELNLVGIFDTLSEGRDPGKPNSYMFPTARGSWRVFRFGEGTKEATTWTQDGDGRTTCVFNLMPDLRTASMANGGVERVSGGYVFRVKEQAEAVCDLLGVAMNIPKAVNPTDVLLKKDQNGRMVAEITKSRLSLIHI